VHGRSMFISLVFLCMVVMFDNVCMAVVRESACVHCSSMHTNVQVFMSVLHQEPGQT